MNHPLRSALNSCRGALAVLVFFSAAINLLMLTAPLYMLQVFDRVLSSRSEDTLLLLSLMALIALLALGALECTRSLALSALSRWIDARLGFVALQSSLSKTSERNTARVPTLLRDVSTIRQFIAGPAIVPMLDAPWAPLFLGAIFLLHPALGWLALAGACCLGGMAIVNEFLTRRLAAEAGDAHRNVVRQAEATMRNADVVEGMGMRENLLRRWENGQGTALELSARLSQRTSATTAISRFLRMVMQIAMLGVGAWLVIVDQLTPGAMIASTILLARALSPVEQSISTWRFLIGARDALKRLGDEIHWQPKPASISLPRPTGELECDRVTFSHPGASEPTLKSVSFKLPAGRTLGLVGPSAAGKTSLARIIVGSAAAQFGHVRLDSIDLQEWDAVERGQYIGYLPQAIELFEGTVAENIARMAEPDSKLVIEAAQAAGVHEMISRLANGYETRIGDAGMSLSGGQKQRIALARALYGNPALVVLDEPNSNLDAAGEVALLNAIRALKRRGTSIVLIAHLPGFIRQADYLVVLGNGSVQLSGPTKDVMARIAGPRTEPIDQTATVFSTKNEGAAAAADGQDYE